MSNNKTIYTIGYADKGIEEFVSCLKKHDIKYLLDVRSEPYSARFPNYNRTLLKKALDSNGIKYAWFGEYFGARRKEDAVFVNSYSLKGVYRQQVCFDKVYLTDPFKYGVERIETALEQNLKICFMCSEKKPIDCHRFWMVAMFFAHNHEAKCNIINIIDVEKDETEEETIAQSDYFECKKKFYQENELEIEGSMLFNLKPIEWIGWWNGLFSDSDTFSSIRHFHNNKIGYIKGDESDD